MFSARIFNKKILTTTARSVSTLRYLSYGRTPSRSWLNRDLASHQASVKPIAEP